MKSRTVLVVDDQPEMGSVATRWLSGQGASVAVVGTAADALQALSRARPDIVCLDLELPDSKGFAALEQIVERYPGLSVVLWSGHDSEEIAEGARRRGARSFLAKPFGRDALLAALRAALLHT